MKINQDTYFWKGIPSELAQRLYCETGVSEDIIPVTARYMQLTSFVEGENEFDKDKPWAEVLVVFYDSSFNTVVENAKVENFVL